jgi:Zinc dependent phospholipase C
MRTLVCVLLAVVTLATETPARVNAWGFTAHKFITERAIALLPPEIRLFFDKYRISVVEHSIDPDTYRTMGFTEEPPRHFVDMDAYGPFPFSALPHDYNEAVARYGPDFVTKNGLLPWRTQEIGDRLSEAFKQTTPYARDDIKLFSAVVAHYVADAFQPFHAALNYDGQLTGQQGIHARFETELFERYHEKIHAAPGGLVPVQSVREFMFATLTDSFQLVDAVLAADRAAVEGRSEYDDQYFVRLFEKTQPILEKRISGAITGVASVINAAWMKAGKPAVPVDAPPRPPRPVRRGI